ncbi:MAG: hypothetical protein ACSHX4_10450 [Opitutaceae bacterium]
MIKQFHALLPTTGPDPTEIAAHFGKRTKKHIEEIDQILTPLQAD